MSGETQSWAERKAALERGDLVVISSRHDNNRRDKTRKDERGTHLRHARSRDKYDQERGFIRPGQTPSEDRLRRSWEREQERAAAREEYEADVQNRLEAREEERRQLAVEAEAEKREREEYTAARMRAHGLDDENSPPKALP
jgi:hypothetical protein